MSPRSTSWCTLSWTSLTSGDEVRRGAPPPSAGKSCCLGPARVLVCSATHNACIGLHPTSTISPLHPPLLTIPTKLTISDTLNLSPLFSLFTCLGPAPPPQNSHKPHTCTHALLYRPSPGDDASAGDRSFLGLLCPIGEYKVYGYTTITQVKIIIIMRDDFDRVNDTDVRGVRSIAKLCA